jgi:hypothetical protein
MVERDRETETEREGGREREWVRTDIGIIDIIVYKTKEAGKDWYLSVCPNEWWCMCDVSAAVASCHSKKEFNPIQSIRPSNPSTAAVWDLYLYLYLFLFSSLLFSLEEEAKAKQKHSSETEPK